MASWLKDPEFRAGVREMAAVGPGIAAWGVMTGVAMVDSGIGIVPVLSASAALRLIGGLFALKFLPRNEPATESNDSMKSADTNAEQPHPAALDVHRT